MQPAADDLTTPWSKRPFHRQWLMEQAGALLDFYQFNAINPAGGFNDLDAAGKPLNAEGQVRGIHSAARAAHCFSLGALLGRPGSADVVDHAMQYLWTQHRDRQNAGYFWSMNADGPVERSKQGYGHAFVLLAAASASTIGHPLAQPMLTDVSEVIGTRFWDAQYGAIADEFDADWAALEGGSYRGQNSNMHMTEALMAAFEATGTREYLTKAEAIAERIINSTARAIDWRVAEHFDATWRIDRDYYHANEMFRPAGTTPGHWLEWSRLILQLWVLGDKRHDWMPDAAEGLFRQAMSLGWDTTRGGFYYTLDWDDHPAKRQKLWWPASEGIGAAHFLNAHRPCAFHEASYRKIWDYLARYHIDRTHGGWHEELTEDLVPAYTLFPGKGDLYHALQACLIPLFPATGSLARVIPQRG